MSESLVLRVKRIVSGSVNGLVDAMETANAEVVMREALREIDRAIDDVRKEMGQVLANRQHTERLIGKTKEKIAELTGRASLAVTQGRDDLAAAALGRQMDLEAQLPALETKHTELYDKRCELDGYIAALETRHREMAADIAAFLSAREAAADLACSPSPDASVGSKAERRAEQAKKAFDRAMNGPVGASPTAATDRDTSAKLHELDRLSRTSDIAARLAALKAKPQAI